MRSPRGQGAGGDDVWGAGQGTSGALEARARLVTEGPAPGPVLLGYGGHWVWQL